LARPDLDPDQWYRYGSGSDLFDKNIYIVFAIFSSKWSNTSLKGMSYKIDFENVDEN
jgi:hypothetical protein